ncbi:hypothetical protein [Paraburkholderia bryophila]|uniref:Uncharacterized protein n=1 Tax=Paraburkholderia bryophila TaxID=420952 RepID=A0A7Y9WQ66_9BURK|nr:hypothetical protein [Paraburkholderia bryophila]NYH24662.1 hypothetical protein [Paraburkholderia bryophila]
MWLLDPKAGLISIIASDRDANVLVCRARTAGSLRMVFGADTEEVELDGRDYAYRAFIDRRTVGAVIAGRLMNLSYTNVKGSIDPQNHALHDAFMETWHTFARIGDRPPYARRSQRKA